MGLNWQRNDYFSMLMAKDKRGHAALEMLVDDLHTDKERSINRFLTHSGSEDFLWGLVKLLGNANSRVAGNAAYILGTLAESELGCIRVIGLTESRHPDAKNILSDLTNMLLFDDAESVMNAAGTMGTLAESVEGRGWMLKETCIMDTVQYITELLNNDNMWTASNAALVLARLTIAEEGCASILDHLKSEHILCRLVNSLGVDEAGRGMNAAFAIGRLCDIEKGRSRLLRLDESEKMISSLARMLCCSDPGASKNACFALSCLATNLEGHTRLLRNSHAEDVLRTLAELLSSEDSETGWFAAMTLRTLAAQPKGCVRLREHSAVLPALKAIESRDNINPDLKDEVIQTLEILKLIEKPQPPKVSVTGAKSVEVEWQESSTKSGFNIRYQIYEGGKCVYQGTDLMCSLSGLSPYTTYTYRLRPVTDGEDGPLSDPVSVTTEEAVPGPPLNVRILGCTTTQLKVGWEPPDCPNGVLKGYYVYIGDKQFEHTHELNSIITGLQPNTSYDLSVCTATSKGKGPRDTVSGTTAEMGAHAPSKPEVNVRGRNEMTVAWRAPEVPLGRITRYDVHMNGSVVYSGTDLHCVAQRLRPDTEYKFVVSAITGEGKCESKSTKKRTAKDEYEGDRAPLYQPPKREDQKDDLKQLPKKRKSISGESSNKAKSASLANAKAHAKLASLRNVKSATVKNRGDSPVQVVYKLTYSTAKHRQKEKEKTIVADPPPVVEPKPPAPEPPTIKAATPPPPPPPPAPKLAAVPVSPPPPKIKLQEPEQEKKQELKELQVVTTPKTPMIKDDGGHLGGRPLLHNNTPVHSEADYSKYQRTTTPEAKLKSLPKPKPPPMRNKQSSRYGNTDSASSSSSAKKTEENNNIVMKHKQGNDILTVEIDRKPEKKQRIKSSDILREGGKMSRRRSLKNTLSAVSGSSQDLEAEMLPPGERSGGGMRGGAGEAEASWLVHSRRYEAQGDITRTFSTLNMNHYRPPPLPRQSTSIMEFDPPIPMPGNKLAQSAAPGHVHRANTFIATHSKSVPLGGGKRGLDRIQAPRSPPNLSQSAHQWKPDFPQVAVKKNHNKFVPMQFRTQPVNLPGQLTRQRTSVGAIDGVGSELAVLNRSRTNIGGFGQGLLNPQEVAADLNNMHSTQTRRSLSPMMDHTITMSPRRPEAMMSSLATMNNHTATAETTLQSAR